MSKIGRLIVEVPTQVDVSIVDGLLTVKGEKGELKWTLPKNIVIERTGDALAVKRTSEDKPTKAAHGLTRSKLFNMVTGVEKGFERILEIAGVGFKAEVQNDQIVLNVGLSHQVHLPILPGTEIKVIKNEVIVSGIDKETVGQMAASIRATKKPEPYKGKGIKYKEEVVRRKAGKAAKTAKV
ncbi:50S ribosomal protein L6 [Patescibacteria group bacterium]|nr:50S ribosomal protein L6 [Patescibacteria group bacterium]